MEEEKQIQEISAEEEQTENTSAQTPSEDDFIIGKGFTIEEPEPEESVNMEKPRKKKKKEKGIVGALIRVFVILIVSGGLAFGILYAGADYLGITFEEGKDVAIVIEEGETIQQIAEQLKTEGVIKIPTLFRLYVKFKHYDSKFQWGRHTVNTESGYANLATALCQKGKTDNQKSVTIPEGFDVDKIAKAFEKAGVCTAADFIDEVQHGEFSYDFVKDIPDQKVYYRLEGYLFPETLQYYCYDPESESDSKECAHLAVDRLLGELNKKLTDEIMAKVKKSGYSLHEIMTMASIVEMEAGGNQDEMPKVAAVFWNRMKSDDFARLESSPTEKYPYGAGKYNTYKCEGLPPGPLCSPSIGAIKATLDPQPDFDYYYFVTDAKMKFYYNKTLAEHNNTIARLQRENNWIGDK